jgi:hypothetical protein
MGCTNSKNRAKKGLRPLGVNMQQSTMLDFIVGKPLV